MRKLVEKIHVPGLAGHGPPLTPRSFDKVALAMASYGKWGRVSTESDLCTEEVLLYQDKGEEKPCDSESRLKSAGD